MRRWEHRPAGGQTPGCGQIPAHRPWPELWVVVSGLLAPALLAAVVLFVLVEATGPGGALAPDHTLPGQVQPAPVPSGLSALLSLLLGAEWQPLATPPRFGALPLVAGTLLVTGIALAAALPLGLGAALWLAALAPPRLGAAVTVLNQLLAAVPSVVIGLVGRGLIGPAVAAALGSRYPQSALAAGLALALMLLPTFVLLATESLRAAPRRLWEAALALGATRWESLTRVVLPAAAPGLVAAALLALGRGMGETMVVLMAAGSVPLLPRSLLDPVEPVTAAIAWEMGEALAGDPHYRVLYLLALLLLVASLAISGAAAWLRRALDPER